MAAAQIESKYQWYRSNGYWNYEPIKVTRRVADGTHRRRRRQAGQDLGAGQLGPLPARSDERRPATGPRPRIGFDAGCYAEASADTPDLLEIALDKPEYRPGDTMTVAVTARSAGKVTLAVIGDKLLTTTTTDVQPGLVKLPLTVGDDWGTGAYVLATLRRPLDAPRSACPAAPSACSGSASTRPRTPSASPWTCRSCIRPETTLRVPIKLAGLTPSEEARVVVVGRRCRHPQPHQLQGAGPRRLLSRPAQAPAEIRDLYGQLIDGMQGTKGQISIRRRRRRRRAARQSADAAAARALFRHRRGGADGTAEVSFDIPGFAGTVRVMAVPGATTKSGTPRPTSMVRDPVVLTATLPRFLLIGDKSTLRLDLDNVEGETGELPDRGDEADGPLSVEGARQDAAARRQEARPRSACRSRRPASATAPFRSAVAGPGDFALERKYALEVRSRRRRSWRAAR